MDRQRVPNCLSDTVIETTNHGGVEIWEHPRIPRTAGHRWTRIADRPPPAPLSPNPRTHCTFNWVCTTRVIFRPASSTCSRSSRQARATCPRISINPCIPCTACLGEIGTGKKGLLLRGHDDRERPSPMSRQRLTDGHIDIVHIRPFLPIHLDRDVIPVEKVAISTSCSRLSNYQCSARPIIYKYQHFFPRLLMFALVL